MANNFISYAEKYLPILDEKLARESKSSILDTNEFNFDGSKTVKIYKSSTSGLGNYDRANGFNTGSVTGDWESFTLTQDKAASFLIDAQDNNEELDLAVSSTVGGFLKDHVNKVVDAYTFSKIASTQGILQGTATDIVVGTTDVASLIDAGTLAVNEADGAEDRILFLSDVAYAALQKNIVRTIQNDAKGINRTIETYDNMEVVRVSKNRFVDSIVQYDGKSEGQTAGDYVLAAGAKYLNFMIVPRGYAKKIVKVAKFRMFDPSVVQSADAWKIDYRLYYDVFIEDNKKGAIYVSKAATAHDAV